MRRALPGKTFLAALVLVAVGSGVNAATFNLEWSNLSAGEFATTATGLSRTLNGVTVTARGYSVTVPSGGGSDTVSGPLPAVDVAACGNLNPALCPGGVDAGLRISRVGLGIRAVTRTAPGDRSLGLNGYTDASGDPVTEFIAFSFSSAVDIGSIVVDDVSNAPRPIWFASSGTAVDFSGGLGSVLSGLGVVNSRDDATDGLFSHVAGLSGVTTLIVGAPFATESFFGIEPRRANFYVRGFADVSLSDVTDPPLSAVPVPAGMPLILSGLLGIGLLARRRKGA